MNYRLSILLLAATMSLLGIAGEEKTLDAMPFGERAVPVFALGKAGMTYVLVDAWGSVVRSGKCEASELRLPELPRGCYRLKTPEKEIPFMVVREPGASERGHFSLDVAIRGMIGRRTAARRRNVTIWCYINRDDTFEQPYVPPVSPLPRGTQGADFYFQTYKESATGIAGRIVVALELGERSVAAALGRQLLGLQSDAVYFRESQKIDRPAFSDCTYTFAISGPLALVELLRNEPENAKLWRAVLAKHADYMVGLYDRAGFDAIPRHRFNFALQKEEILLGNSSGSALHNAVFFAQSAELLGEARFLQYAQRCFDWVCGANPEEASYINGAGYNQKRNPVFGQFFPRTPQIPGGVQHVMQGEYDMPSVGMALWTIALLSETEKTKR